jgi:hypothetical protein
MGRRQKKIQIGESPFQKRVCSKSGINIYLPVNLEAAQLKIILITHLVGDFPWLTVLIKLVSTIHLQLDLCLILSINGTRVVLVLFI